MNGRFPVFERFPYVWLAILGVLWGANFMFMKLCAASLAPSQIVWLRLAFGAVALSPFLPAALGAVRRNRRLLLHVSVMTLFANMLTFHCFMEGTARLSSGAAGVLSGSIPLQTAMLAALFLPEERLTLPKLAGLAVSFLGIVSIVGPWNGLALATLSGALYMLLGGLGYAVAFVYARRYLAAPGVSALSIAALQMLLATLFYAPFAQWQGIDRFYASPEVFDSVAIGLGAFGSGIAYAIYYGLIQSLGAVQASSVTYLPPLVALLFGAVFLHEAITVHQMAGCALVLGGIYLLRRASRNAGRRVPARR